MVGLFFYIKSILYICMTLKYNTMEKKPKRDLSGMKPKKKPKPVRVEGRGRGRPKGSKDTKKRKKYRRRLLSEKDFALRKEIKANPIKIYKKRCYVPKRTVFKVEYDFLKYIYIIFRWARENFKDLSRRELEMLLFLYTEGAFTQRKFSIYYKPLGLYPRRARELLVSKGWLNVFRPKTSRQTELYTLSTKAKYLCNRMHKMSIGLEKVPESPKFNKMNDKDSPKSNTYYLDLIKRMNKDKPPKE